MTIRSEAELAGIRRAGAVVAAVLRTLERAVEPGITTGELDALCARELARRDAEPTPARELRFPGSICISVNDEAVHGVPGQRRVERGDLVKLDLVATRDGFVADSALTVCVPPVSALGRGLVRAARGALDTALANVRAGLPLRALGRVAIERTVRRAGFQVIRELGGHGVGRAVHEEPHVPNWGDPLAEGQLHEGLVVAIEPIVTSGAGGIYESHDGWTLRTRDRAPVAHWEHTLVVTRGRPIVVTA
jgi:methionyl aminopeptidase